MKFVSTHFKFDIKSRRFTKSVWEKYYSLKKQKALSEKDKHWIKQMRASLKINQFKLIGTHVPSKTTEEWVVKKDLTKEKFSKLTNIKSLLNSVKEKRKKVNILIFKTVVYLFR